jgi:hypothetical protein
MIVNILLLSWVATTNEYAREVANTIKFSVGGEWVDASSDVISLSTEHGPTEHGIAKPSAADVCRW